MCLYMILTYLRTYIRNLKYTAILVAKKIKRVFVVHTMGALVDGIVDLVGHSDSANSALSCR